MENNSENKLRFFYQYGGQKVLKNEKYQEVSFLNGFFFFNNATYIENYHLELRSIDSITDEECVELSKYIFGENFHLMEDYEIVNEYNIWHSFIQNKDFSILTSVFIDFLRSKGFLVPFMNLTTDQILSYGWAKIKEHEQ